MAEGKDPTWDRPKHDQWFFGDVSFPPIPDQTIGVKFQLQLLRVNTVFDNNGTITYTGLPVFFESSNPNIASIDGTVLNINNPGTVTIWAGQQGNERFNPTLDWKSINSSRTFTAVYPPPPAYPPPPPAHAQTYHAPPPAYYPPPPPPPAYYPPPPPPPAHTPPPAHFPPPPAHFPPPAYHAPTPAHTHTPAQQSMSGLHDLVFRFDSRWCDPTIPLNRQSDEFKGLISNIQTNPNAYNPDRGHTFLYSAFRGTGNICLIRFMMAAGCDIMQPNKPMPKWMWESDVGQNYSDCHPDTQKLLETTLVRQFVTAATPTHVDVNDPSNTYKFNFNPINITTSGTQVVVDVQGVGTKTDIVVSRDITTGTWTWFMNDEQFNYPPDVSRVLETEFKTNNGNGFCKFTSPGLIISEVGQQPTVNLIQVKFITNAVLRQTNMHTGSARSVIRVCDTSYPFHGAIQRLRLAANLADAISHSENITSLAGLFRPDNMYIIKTLRNDIFYPREGTKHTFLAIHELLAAKNELLSRFNNQDLISSLDRLVNTFSIQGKDIDDLGKPLTPCTNVTVHSDREIAITINSTSVRISIGSFIEFDRWVMNYNPTHSSISIAKTKAIVTHFGGSFSDTNPEKSSVNRIFYLPWREAGLCWTTSSYPRAIGLTSGYLNEYWDTIKIIGCPSSSSSPKLCTLEAIRNWQDDEYKKSKSAKKK